MKYVYEFTNQRKLTKAEFLKWFSKKALYTIRKFKMIKKGDKVYYENKRNFKDVVLEDILKRFSEKGNIVLLKNKASTYNKIAISSTLDSESESFISKLIKEKPENFKNLTPISGKIIKPLYLFLDKEVLLYAKLQKLKFKKSSFKETRFSEIINNLEKKHPEIKFSIIKGYLELN